MQPSLMTQGSDNNCTSYNHDETVLVRVYMVCCGTVLLGDQHALPAVRQGCPEGRRTSKLHQLLPVDPSVPRLSSTDVLPAATDLEVPESQVRHHAQQHHRRSHRLSAKSRAGRSWERRQVSLRQSTTKITSFIHWHLVHLVKEIRQR